jgi:hypothetical protein
MTTERTSCSGKSQGKEIFFRSLYFNDFSNHFRFCSDRTLPVEISEILLHLSPASIEFPVAGGEYPGMSEESLPPGITQRT